MIFSRANFGALLTSVSIQGCGLVTGVVTARLLGPAGRGELATVMLWPIIMSNLGLMGCNWALARAVAKNPDREADWVYGAAALGISTATVYFALGYLLIPYVLPMDRRYLVPLARLCLLLVPLDIFNQILLAIEHGRMRWRRFNLMRASFFIFYAVFVFALWITRKPEVRWFVWVFLAGQVMAVCVRLMVQRRSFVTGKLRPADCFHLLRSGLPYFGATASNLLALQLDKVIVVGFMSAKLAGLYVVALTFANAQSSLGEALGIISFAAFSNEKDVNRQREMLTETFRQSAVISMGLGVLLSGLIPFLIGPLFGGAFSEAIQPAMLLALAAAMTGPTGILNEGLRGAGRPYAGIASQLLGTAVLALAAGLLLQRFGLMGMAFAVLLSACSQLTVLVIAAASWLQISPSCFWPFGPRDIKTIWHGVAALRLRDSKSPA